MLKNNQSAVGDKRKLPTVNWLLILRRNTNGTDYDAASDYRRLARGNEA